jgi:pilus assembly protein CpaC
MHRANRYKPAKLAAAILGLTLGGSVWAQERPVIPALATSSAPVAQIELSVAQAPAPAPAQPQAGQQAPVQRSAKVVLAIGGTQKLQAASKKKLLTVESEKANIVKISPIEGDPTTVLLTGLEAGSTRVRLVDESNKEESVEVIVQFDVQYLKSLLTQAVPSSSVTPIPGANNTIILTGSVARAEDVQVVLSTAGSVVGADRIINALRVGGVMQVQLDVVVATVSREKIRQMAFDFINDGTNHVIASTVGQGFVVPAGAISGTFPGFPVISNTVGAPNGQPANLFLGIFNSKQDFFGLLQALKTENLTKVLAEPKLIAISGKPASFISGGEQAIPVPAGLGQVGVQFEEFGTRLNFLPIVLGNGRIWLEVEPEISDLNAAFGTTISGTVVPGRSTQRIHTTVELESGQTYVLGGLIERHVQATNVKVPVLGDLPFLGAAFSSKSYDERETELLICVTPYLVDAMSCDQAPKIFPGQETRSPDDFELFLEGILEAPRGPRQVIQDKHYVPAYKNGPSASIFPCATNGNCGDKAAGCTTCPKTDCPTVKPLNTDVMPAPTVSQPVQAPDGRLPGSVSDAKEPAVLPPAVIGGKAAGQQ